MCQYLHYNNVTDQGYDMNQITSTYCKKWMIDTCITTGTSISLDTIRGHNNCFHCETRMFCWSKTNLNGSKHNGTPVHTNVRTKRSYLLPELNSNLPLRDRD